MSRVQSTFQVPPERAKRLVWNAVIPPAENPQLMIAYPGFVDESWIFWIATLPCWLRNAATNRGLL